MSLKSPYVTSNLSIFQATKLKFTAKNHRHVMKTIVVENVGAKLDLQENIQTAQVKNQS